MMATSVNGCFWHGDAEAGAVVGMAEIHQPFPFGRHDRGHDRGELPLFDRRNKVGDRHLAQLVLQAEVAGDMPPQTHGDAVPVAVAILHGKWGRLDDADDPCALVVHLLDRPYRRDRYKHEQQGIEKREGTDH